MERVTMYRSKSGHLFSTEKEPIVQDYVCELKEWYEANELFGNCSCVVWSDLIEWLSENRDKVEAILKVI